MIKTGGLYRLNFNSAADIVVNQGGTSCFSFDTKVVTSEGSKPISSVKVGDSVKSYNEASEGVEYKRVTNVMKFDNHKRTVKVKLKNGEFITCTEDHKFFYKGGWISIKHLLSLKDESSREL